ncbi:MAG: hypothetical protein ACTSPR_07380 [Candidatus Thorarchaeota archaeon]
MRARVVFVLIVVFFQLPVLAIGDLGSSSCITVIVPLTTGSSVDFDRSDVVSSDVSGEASFYLSSDGYTDIKIDFLDGDRIVHTESNEIPVVREVVSYNDGRRYETLAMYDYVGATFVTLGLLTNGSTYVCVATTIEGVQYSGMCMVGPDGIDSSGSKALKSWCHETRTVTGKNFTSTRDPYGFSVVPEVGSHIESKTTSTEDAGFSPLSSGGTAYFLQHYRGDFQCEWNVRVGSEYILPYSWCAYEIRRVWPDRAQILSDLRSYSTQYVYNPSNNRYIGGYYLGFEGGHAKKNWWEWWEQVYFQISGSERLWRDDIISCWISFGVGNCRPTYAIVTAAACYSLWDASMAVAFTNYGAACYYGAPGTLPGNLNLWIRDFWGKGLAYYDMTIQQADSAYEPMHKFEWYPSTAGSAVLPNNHP